jgi:Polyketide cyclase / dehydrase and lipid transport
MAMRLAPFAVLLAACSTTPPAAPSGTCRDSPEPAEPVPAPSPDDAVVFHEEQFEVVGERAAFVRAFLAAPLERFIEGTSALPGVDHTEPLTPARYPTVGSVRLVCLKDGESAHEEVVAQDEGQLRYVVTRYTSKAAQPLAYGMGAFTFTPRGANTHVTWRYTFKLRGNRFPGWLGALGRALFRKSFVEADYAPFMQAQVRAIQDFAAHEVGS